MSTNAADHPIPNLSGNRIVIMLDVLELGGAERQAILLAHFLKSIYGAQVEVWGLQSPGPAIGLCERYELGCRIWPFNWTTATRAQRGARLLELINALRENQPDILIPYTIVPNTICGMIWRCTGARSCIWNQEDAGHLRAGRRAEKLAVRLTPWFISNSYEGAKFLCQTLGAPERRVRVIPNGVQLSQPERGRAEWRRELGVGDETFVTCMVAHIHGAKDHVTLLRAWQHVVDELARTEGRDAILLLAGRLTSASDQVKALAYDLDLRRNVRFLGHVTDVSGLLNAVDLSVFSSRTEGCPNGVLESMAAGLAVVATDIPGIREAVGERGYPHLSAPGDAEDMAGQIVRLARDPALRRELGARNRSRAAQEFSLDRMCESTANLIAEALHRTGQPQP